MPIRAIDPPDEPCDELPEREFEEPEDDDYTGPCPGDHNYLEDCK
jgi:hypothetical protein